MSMGGTGLMPTQNQYGGWQIGAPAPMAFPKLSLPATGKSSDDAALPIPPIPTSYAQPRLDLGPGVYNPAAQLYYGGYYPPGVGGWGGYGDGIGGLGYGGNATGGPGNIGDGGLFA